MSELLSIVVPCYNEAEVLPLFFDKLCENIAKIDSVQKEIIFVDDGSTDESLEIIKSFAARAKTVKVNYVSFSRNFGKEAAIFAGLERANGDYVVLMDADLQHPPKYIEAMLREVRDGDNDCAAMFRENRKDGGVVRRLCSKLFFRIMKKLTKTNIVEGATDYRLMTRRMVNAVLSLKEYNRFSKGIFGFVGFKTKWISYQDEPRAAGSTKWSFFGLLKYSIDGIVAFSTAPLVLASVFGFVFCLIAAIMAVIVVVKTLIWGDPVAGFPTLFCIIMMVGGVLLLFLGIQGQYMSRLYMEAKHRPVYIERESNIKKEDEQVTRQEPPTVP